MVPQDSMAFTSLDTSSGSESVGISSDPDISESIVGIGLSDLVVAGSSCDGFSGLIYDESSPFIAVPLLVSHNLTIPASDAEAGKHEFWLDTSMWLFRGWRPTSRSC